MQQAAATSRRSWRFTMRHYGVLTAEYKVNGGLRRSLFSVKVIEGMGKVPTAVLKGANKINSNTYFKYSRKGRRVIFVNTQPRFTREVVEDILKAYFEDLDEIKRLKPRKRDLKLISWKLKASK